MLPGVFDTVQRYFHMYPENTKALITLQLWIQERLPLATCKDYGNNLQGVQQQVKKNQVGIKDDVSHNQLKCDLTLLSLGS